MRMTQLNQPLQQKVSIISESKELDQQIIFNEPLIAHRLSDELNNEVLDRAFLSNVIPCCSYLSKNTILLYQIF